MAFCGKYQAWSGAPNAHTTGFHDVALLAGSNYRLPSTHPFSRHRSTTLSSNSTGNGTSAPVLNTAASVPREEVAASSDLIQVSKSKATQILATFRLPLPIQILQLFLVLLEKHWGYTCKAWHVWLLRALSSKSRPTFFSDSCWLHWNYLLRLFDYSVPIISYQATNEPPPTVTLSSSTLSIHHQSTIITHLPT